MSTSMVRMVRSVHNRWWDRRKHGAREALAKSTHARHGQRYYLKAITTTAPGQVTQQQTRPSAPGATIQKQAFR